MSEYGYFVDGKRPNLKPLPIREVLVNIEAIRKVSVGIDPVDIERAWRNHLRETAKQVDPDGKKYEHFRHGFRKMPHQIDDERYYCSFTIAGVLTVIYYEPEFVGLEVYLIATMISESEQVKCC